MANQTTLRITATDNGNNYRIDILEPDAKNGGRIDQKTAQMIVAMDGKLRSKEYQQAMQSAQSNPNIMGMLQNLLGGGGNGQQQNGNPMMNMLGGLMGGRR